MSMLINPKNILLPRFDTFGDIVIFEAFVASLREVFPDAKITLLVCNGYDDLAAIFPASLNLHWLTVDQHAYVAPTECDKSNFLAELKHIIEAGWDAVVLSAYNHTWLDNLLLEQFTDAHVFFVLGSTSDALTYSSALCSVVPADESIHEIEKYRIFLEHLTGDTALLPMPQLVINHNLADERREELIKLQLEGLHYVACLPAGTNNQKNKVWPLDRYVEILCWLAETRGLVPLIVGHVTEETPVRSLAKLIGTRGVDTRIWLGQTGDIPVLSALLEHAALYVGSDSGPMHISAALEVPTVGIFGGGHRFRFLPVGKRAIGVAAEIPCYGCHWNCIFDDAPCVRLVEVDHVKEAVGMVVGSEHLESRLLNVASRLPQALIEIIAKTKYKYDNLQKPMVDDSLLERSRVAGLLDELQRERLLLEALQGSLSWRLTAPFRKICEGLRQCLK